MCVNLTLACVNLTLVCVNLTLSHTCSTLAKLYKQLWQVTQIYLHNTQVTEKCEIIASPVTLSPTTTLHTKTEVWYVRIDKWLLELRRRRRLVQAARGVCPLPTAFGPRGGRRVSSIPTGCNELAERLQSQFPYLVVTWPPLGQYDFPYKQDLLGLYCEGRAMNQHRVHQRES